MVQFQYPSGGDRLTGVFQILQNYGFQDFLLPFALFFALLFAILQKVNLFADRKINGFISGAIAGLITVPHVLQMYPANMDPIQLMYQFLPMSTIAFVILLFLLLFIGMVSEQSKFNQPSAIRAIAGLVAAGVVLVSFLRFIAPSLIPDWLTIDPTTQALAIVIAVMALVVWFIAGEDSDFEIHRDIPKWFGHAATPPATQATPAAGGRAPPVPGGPT